MTLISMMCQDNSGFICSKEFGPLLRALGRNPTHAEVNSLMARVDVDHNGKLDLGEFIMMMHNNSIDFNRENEQEQDIKQAFRSEHSMSLNIYTFIAGLLIEKATEKWQSRMLTFF